jgi:ABC-type amino acid transport substrate-binding protein
MATRTGTCPNRGCQYGYSHKPIPISEGSAFICPGCGSPLVPISQTGGRSPAFKLLLLALPFAAILVLAIVAYKIWINPPTAHPFDGPGSGVSVTPTPISTTTGCKGLPMHSHVWSDIQKRGYLIMGVQASAPPMNNSPDRDKWDEEKSEADEDERRLKELSWKRTGFDYELARMLAFEMGLVHDKNVRAREVAEFKDLFCLLNRKEKDGSFSVDIIMSGIARDPAYDDTISWTKSYAEFGYALVTKKSSYIETLADCKNKKIGIVQGDNIVKQYVTQQLPNSQLVELSDESDEWLSDALNLNQVDAVVYDYPFAVEEVKGINEQVKEQGVLGKLLEIRIASLPNSQLKYSIGVPKGEEDLLAMLNDAIDRVTAEDNPRYADLIRKYFKSQDIKQVQIAPGARIYIVKRGDSLARIAARELGDENRWRELGALNNIGNDHLIVPNQKLVLPQ